MEPSKISPAEHAEDAHLAAIARSEQERADRKLRQLAKQRPG